MPQIIIAVVLTALLVLFSWVQSTVNGLQEQLNEEQALSESRLNAMLASEERLLEVEERAFSLFVQLHMSESLLAEYRMMIEAEELRYSDMIEFLERVNESGGLNLTPEEIEVWVDAVIRAGDMFGIDPRRLIGVAYRESRLGTYSIGPERPLTVEGETMRAEVRGDYRNGVWRSCGPFQIQFRYQPESCWELMDVHTSAMVAARFLNKLRETCDPRYYLAAYNGGCRNKGIAATQGYQRRVIAVASL